MIAGSQSGFIDRERLQAVTRGIIFNQKLPGGIVAVSHINLHSLANRRQKVVINVEIHRVLPGRSIRAPGKAVVVMRRRRQRTADTPQRFACIIGIELCDEAVVVAGVNLPAGIVEAQLAARRLVWRVALRDLPPSGCLHMIHRGPLAGKLLTNLHIAVGIALGGAATVSGRLRKPGGIGRVESVMKDTKSSTRRSRIKFRRPFVEKLPREGEAVGRSALQTGAAPIPNTHADVELLERRPIHAQRDVQREVGILPRLIHFISGKELEIRIDRQGLEHRHIRLGFGQMVSPKLTTVLDAEPALHIGKNPIPLGLLVGWFHRNKQEWDDRARPLLECLTVYLE